MDAAREARSSQTARASELPRVRLSPWVQGYSFPINPVWPVRDPGWLEVLRALQQHEEAASNLLSWFPPESGVLQRIEDLNGKYPNGFTVARPPREPLKGGAKNRRASVWTTVKNLSDCDVLDVANVATLAVEIETQARWLRIRRAMKKEMLKHSATGALSPKQ